MKFYLILIPIISFVFLISVNEINYISSQQIPDDHLLSQTASVKITSHSDGQTVPVGKLTISGISNDDPERNCIVYVDWNDKKPFQQVRPTGPGGIDDFSEWFFTYDSNYYTIAEGNNDLTSKITCTDIPGSAGTKWYSVNLIGVPQPDTSNTNQQNNIPQPIEEPSSILTPGFVTNFKNKKVQTNLENSSIFGDEPSQKIIPGFVTNFKNKKVQTNLENSTSDLVNESFELGSSKTHLVKDTKITNSFPTSNTSAIETNDIFFPNNNREVNHQKNDSEIHMMEDNLTKVTFSEDNNKSNKTVADLKSLEKKINHNNEIDSLSLDNLSVVVTFPEPIIQNNNYSSELLVLGNSVPVTAAKIYGEISSSMNSNYTTTFIGKTDNNGIYNFPLKISNLFPTGEYNLKIIITKSGSHNSTFSTSFFVLPNFRSTQDLERANAGDSLQIEQFEGKNNNNKKFSYSNNSESKLDQNLSLSSSNYDNMPFSLDEFPILKQLPSTSEVNKDKEKSVNFSNFKSQSSFP